MKTEQRKSSSQTIRISPYEFILVVLDSLIQSTILHISYNEKEKHTYLYILDLTVVSPGIQHKKLLYYFVIEIIEENTNFEFMMFYFWYEKLGFT